MTDRYYNKVEYLERIAVQRSTRFFVLCDMFVFHLYHISARRESGHRNKMRRLLTSTRLERRHSVQLSPSGTMHSLQAVVSAEIFRNWIVFAQCQQPSCSIEPRHHTCIVSIGGLPPMLVFLGPWQHRVEVCISLNSSQLWAVSLQCQDVTMYAILEPRTQWSGFGTIWHSEEGTLTHEPELRQLQLFVGATSICLFAVALLILACLFSHMFCKYHRCDAQSKGIGKSD